MKLKFILGVGLLLGLFLPAMGDDGASRYTGRVVDEQGHPVAGATVECYRYPDDIAGMGYQNWEPQPDQSTQTDSQGGFAVSASRDTTLVVVKKAGFAIAWKTWSNGPEDTSDPVVLSPPSFLAGVVVDDSGRPVAGAEVWVAYANIEGAFAPAMSWNLLEGQPARLSFSVRTGPDGRFRIDNFPAHGQASLAVSKAGLAQHPVGANIVSDAQAGDEHIQLVVGPAGAIAGQVVEEATGRPLAGVMVRLDGRGANIHGAEYRAPVISGSNGEFFAPDLQPGTYSAGASIPRPLQSDWVAPDAHEIDVVAGTTTTNVLIHVTHGAAVDVTVVVTNTLKPLAGVIVASGQTTRLTDDNGLARVWVIPGEVRIFAHKSGWKSSEIIPQTVIVIGATNQVRIELTPPHHITGTVLDPAGEPVSGAIISFHPGHNMEAPQYAETVTDAAGNYELIMREGGFSLFTGSVNKTNFILARSVERNLATLQEFTELPTHLDLTLQPGITLSGSVVDVAGAPVTTATVDLEMMVSRRFSHLWSHPVPVDARGTFVFPGLPQGRPYGLYYGITAPGYGTDGDPVRAENTLTNHYEFPAFVLKRPDLRLAGQVLDKDGQPLAGVRVEYSGAGQIPWRVTDSDGQGRFQFENVCAGKVRVFINDIDGDVFAQGGDLNVVVRKGIHTPR